MIRFLKLSVYFELCLLNFSVINSECADFTVVHGLRAMNFGVRDVRMSGNSGHLDVKSRDVLRLSLVGSLYIY